LVFLIEIFHYGNILSLSKSPNYFTNCVVPKTHKIPHFSGCSKKHSLRFSQSSSCLILNESSSGRKTKNKAVLFSCFGNKNKREQPPFSSQWATHIWACIFSLFWSVTHSNFRDNYADFGLMGSGHSLCCCLPSWPES